MSLPASLWLLALAFGADLPRRVAVGPGVFRPLSPAAADERQVPVAAFSLDALPVTNKDFLEFVSAREQWRRDRIKPVFADSGYLQHWAAPLQPGGAEATRPVTFVSWFAARAYCAWASGRLPTETEWEFAAAADQKQHDARGDPRFRQQLLDWYGRPNPPHPAEVGQGTPNVWGIRDLHGLVWEWVLDFGNTMVGDDSRGLFCGASAANAREKEDYPSFMRLAYRSALEARYTVGNLGFRCAGGKR